MENIRQSKLIFVHKHNLYGRTNDSFSKVSQFLLNESDPCKMITGLSFAKVLSLNFVERQPISSNIYSYNARWLHILTGQCITMSINGASTILGLVSKIMVK